MHFFSYSLVLFVFIGSSHKQPMALVMKILLDPSCQFFFFFHFILENAATAKSLQSCLTLCDPIDSSPSGSPVPGILQARTLEWVATSPMHESEK